MTPDKMDEVAAQLLTFVVQTELPPRDIEHLASAARILHHHAKQLRVQQVYGRATHCHPNRRTFG